MVLAGAKVRQAGSQRLQRQWLPAAGSAIPPLGEWGHIFLNSAWHRWVALALLFDAFGKRNAHVASSLFIWLRRQVRVHQAPWCCAAVIRFKQFLGGRKLEGPSVRSHGHVGDKVNAVSICLCPAAVRTDALQAGSAKSSRAIK